MFLRTGGKSKLFELGFILCAGSEAGIFWGSCRYVRLHPSASGLLTNDHRAIGFAAGKNRSVLLSRLVARPRISVQTDAIETSQEEFFDGHPTSPSTC